MINRRKNEKRGKLTRNRRINEKIGEIMRK